MAQDRADEDDDDDVIITIIVICIFKRLRARHTFSHFLWGTFSSRSRPTYMNNALWESRCATDDGHHDAARRKFITHPNTHTCGMRRARKFAIIPTRVHAQSSSSLRRRRRRPRRDEPTSNTRAQPATQHTSAHLLFNTPAVAVCQPRVLCNHKTGDASALAVPQHGDDYANHDLHALAFDAEMPCSMLNVV